MTLRLLCHHGHRLETKDASSIDDLTCNRCGSVSMRIDEDTRKDRPNHVTSDCANQGSDDLEADFDGSNLEDPMSSMFLTQDEESVRDGQGRKASVRSNLPASGLNASRPSEGPSGNGSRTRFEPPRLAGFKILEELGRGGMGVVYRAQDIQRGREVALKTLQRMNPSSLQRFKAEFRTLADIAHPNLASLYELLSDGQTWCFSMEVLNGVDFLQYIWSGFDLLDAGDDPSPSTSDSESPRLTDQRIERLQEATKQLTLGLDALHQAGILHSDIKPSNVLMTTEGRLLLLDFGLAAPLDDIKGESKVIQGTPLYMSPEQGRADSLTTSSDWYSVGVMLYELLTGQLPFRGKAREVLAKKQAENPIDPADLRPDNPENLNQLCRALLDHDPSARPSASEVLRCLGATGEAAELDAFNQSAAKSLSVQLVGRDRHRETLRRTFAEVTVGDTLCAFVHGTSGMGKSVLVRSFLNDIGKHEEVVILEGRCYEQESVPFKALDSLIDSLATFLKTLNDELVHSVMPRDRLALIRVFPVLGGAPEVAGATYPSIDNADDQELRQRAMNALRELLQRLAIRAPLVLYVDDLQWGDVDSAGLLADLVRPPDAPRMLLLASYRSEDIGKSPCLQAVSDAFNSGPNRPNFTQLSVEALTQEESRQLALSLLDGDPQVDQAYATRIAEESGGLPFFVWELAQYVQEDPEVADQKLVLDDVIWSRISRLPEESIRMLQLIAVVGRPTPTTEVYQAADALAKGPSVLGMLRAKHFARTTESQDEGTVVEAYHDRIRESVLNHLDPQIVKELHQKLAVTIEQASGIIVDDVHAYFDQTPDFEEPDQPYELEKQQWQRVFDVAYFHDAAGQYQRAFPYALLAAEQSRTQHALEVAEQQFRIALRGASSVRPGLRFRVLDGLGDVLVLRGRYDEANEQFEAARALVSGNQRLARMDFKRGVAFLKKGDMGEARDYLETAITAIGERIPSKMTVVPRAIKEAAVQLLHSRFPHRFVARRDLTTPTGQLDLLRVRIYDQLTFSYWFTRGMNYVLWSHLRQMNLAECYPPSSELGKTYAFHAITMSGIPMAERGVAYAEKAYAISVDKGDFWGQGRARSFQTFALLVLGRFKEGVETGLEAVQLLEQAGDVWEANMARMIATVPMYHLGDLETAYRQSKKAYEIGIQTGDYSAVCISLLFWLPANPKTIPPGAIEAELGRPREDPLTIVAMVYAKGLELLLCDDQPREAAKVLEDSLAQARRLGARNVCLFSAATWKATALRMTAEREPDGPVRQRAIGEALQAVRAALKITKKYRACRSHALRERALIAELAGNEDQARRFFDQSLQSAEAYQARYDQAKTLLARGQAGKKFGWPDSADQIAQAQTALSEIEDFE